MNATFLLLFNLYLACWLGLFLLFFRRSTWFKMNRFILLSGIFWAIILPWTHFRWTSSVAEPVSSGTVSIAGLHADAPIFLAHPAVHAAFSFPVWHVIEIIYWSGVVVMLCLFIRKIIQLYLFIKKFPKQVEKDHVRIFTTSQHAIFSFGKYLFAPQNVPDAILRHEIVHIREKHTMDNLLLETVKIFCWFNPVVYLYQNVLKDLHEYAADAIVTRYSAKEEYARLLAGYAFQTSNIAFTHHFFSRSQLQKRLIMLHKQSIPQKAGRKYLLIVPLLAALIVISFSSFTLKNKVNDMISKLSPSNQPFDVKGIVTDQDGNPISRATVLVVNTTEGAITNNKGEFEIDNVSEGGLLMVSMIGYSTIHVQIDSDKKLHLTLYSNPSRLNQLVVTGYSGENPKPNSQLNEKVVTGHPIEKSTSKSSQLNPNYAIGYPIRNPQPVEEGASNSPIAFVEQMPSFPGGEEALTKFLRDNVRYPQQARKEKLQGNVYVSFVVGKDGSLSQVHTIGKTIGGGLEQEAVRLIKAMPKWVPGHQNGEAVAVPYTLPIWFVLQ